MSFRECSPNHLVGEGSGDGLRRHVRAEKAHPRTLRSAVLSPRRHDRYVSMIGTSWPISHGEGAPLCRTT